MHFMREDEVLKAMRLFEVGSYQKGICKLALKNGFGLRQFSAANTLSRQMTKTNRPKHRRIDIKRFLTRRGLRKSWIILRRWSLSMVNLCTDIGSKPKDWNPHKRCAYRIDALNGYIHLEMQFPPLLMFSAASAAFEDKDGCIWE